MIGLIADVHGNIDALESVLTALADRGIRDIYAAGDLVGYNAAPNECCERLRAAPAVKGNHEWAALLDPDDEDLVWFNEEAREAAIWTGHQLTPANRALLAALPLQRRFVAGGRRVALVHGSPEDPLFEYTYEDASDAWCQRLLEVAAADILIMGHTHQPYVRRVGAGLVINPGSVGQPRDGDPRAACAILDPATLQVEILRLDYDIGTATRRNRAAGLPPWLSDRLSQGR